MKAGIQFTRQRIFWISAPRLREDMLCAGLTACNAENSLTAQVIAVDMTIRTKPNDATSGGSGISSLG